MHEHDQRAVARDVVGNRGSIVPLQGPGTRHPVTPNAPSVATGSFRRRLATITLLSCR